MSEHTDKPEPFTMGHLLALCRLDSVFRSEFLADPRYVLNRYQVEGIPGDVPIHVVEVPFGTLVIAINPLIEQSTPSES